jgi:hypothetical protein
MFLKISLKGPKITQSKILQKCTIINPLFKCVLEVSFQNGETSPNPVTLTAIQKCAGGLELALLQNGVLKTPFQDLRQVSVETRPKKRLNISGKGRLGRIADKTLLSLDFFCGRVEAEEILSLSFSVPALSHP